MRGEKLNALHSAVFVYIYIQHIGSILFQLFNGFTSNENMHLSVLPVCLIGVFVVGAYASTDILSEIPEQFLKIIFGNLKVIS